jgi:hypothetical protein
VSVVFVFHGHEKIIKEGERPGLSNHLSTEFPVAQATAATTHLAATTIPLACKFRAYLAPGQLTTNSTLGYTRAPLYTSWASHACLATALVNLTLSYSILPGPCSDLEATPL